MPWMVLPAVAGSKTVNRVFMATSISVFRYGESIPGLGAPLSQPGNQLLTLGPISVQLREIHLLVRIFIQVELEPGVVLEADVFPAVAGYDPAVGSVQSVGLAGRHHRLQICRIGTGAGRRAVDAMGAEIGALHPIWFADAAKPKRGGCDVHMVGQYRRAAVLPGLVAGHADTEDHRRADGSLVRAHLAKHTVRAVHVAMVGEKEDVRIGQQPSLFQS